MALTTAETDQALDFLGFAGGVTDYTTAAGPLVSVVSLRTNAEAQLARVNDYGEARVRSILATMEAIEAKLEAAQCRLAASKIGSIATREREPEALEAEWRRWGWRLADLIGCKPNPYSPRYQGGGVNVARC